MGSKIHAMLLVALMSVFSVFSLAAPAHADNVFNKDGVVLTFSDGILINDGAAIQVSYTFVCQHPTGDPAVEYYPFNVTQKINSNETASGTNFDSGSGGLIACDPASPYSRDVIVQADSVPFTTGKAVIGMSYYIYETDPGILHPTVDVSVEIKIKKK